MRLIRSATITLCGTLFLACPVLGAIMEQQTTNENINGLAPWVASFGTAPQQVSVNNNYLSVGGAGGAGQFFVVNGKSQYQIAKCFAAKAGDGWAGFGVTYYDASWNEVGVQYKEVKSDLRFGGSPTLYSIGLVPPQNAVYAYLWIWNSDSSGYLIATGIKVMNYFPERHHDFDASQSEGNQFTQTFPNNRNRIINGSFETYQRSRRDVVLLDDYYEGDEFWNVVGADSSVYRTDGAGADDFGLRMGSQTETNLIYQTVNDVQAGQPYELLSYYGRRNYGGEGSPYVIAGVDFYDASGNKLGDTTINMDKNWRDGRFGGPALEVVDFTPPAGTTRTVVWVWAEATGSSGAYVTVASMIIRPAN